MSGNTTLTLAVLMAQWEQRQHDQIETFVPFVLNLLKKERYEVVNVSELQQDFLSEYGIAVPYQPLQAIVHRLSKTGLIKRTAQGSVPNYEQIDLQDFDLISKEQERNYNKVIDELVRFAKDRFSVKLTADEANAAILSFLSRHKQEILFASQRPDEGILSNVRTDNEHLFIVHSFIVVVYERDHDIFSYFKDLAIAYLLANTLLYTDFDRYVGALKDQNCYLDTPLIIPLLISNNNEAHQACEEFVELLFGEGANLLMFEHTYDEITFNLRGALEHVGRPTFDPCKASMTARTLAEEGASESDIELLLSRLDQKIEQYNIAVVETPEHQENSDHQVDEERLKESIISVYSDSFDPTEKSWTLQKDIDSLSAIYLLRKGSEPVLLNRAEHIFITSNSSLAYASRVFEDSATTIPVCLTEVFLGTLIWLRRPAVLTPITEKKLLADTFAAMKPDRRLLKALCAQLDKLENQGVITSEESYLLRTNRVAFNLLEKNTMGNVARFDESTPTAMLEEMNASYRVEVRKELDEVKQEFSKYRVATEFDKASHATAIDQKLATEAKLDKIAHYTASVIAWFPVIILGGLSVLYLFSSITAYKPYLVTVPVFAGMTLGSLFWGFNLKNLKHKAYTRIKRTILGFFI